MLKISSKKDFNQRVSVFFSVVVQTFSFSLPAVWGFLDPVLVYPSRFGVGKTLAVRELSQDPVSKRRQILDDRFLEYNPTDLPRILADGSE